MEGGSQAGYIFQSLAPVWFYRSGSNKALDEVLLREDVQPD